MDGIILINKEKNYTSNDVVQIAKKVFNKKVGHTGTLDPMATGVLPLLIGKGTLCSKYLINHDKIYIAKLKLGIKTDTADITGNIISEENFNHSILNKNYINCVLNNFLGEQEQVPPMYSAIKINGKKLYEYARKRQNVDIAPRKINIYKLELISVEKDIITFSVFCSKGTYIRTLCEDIAKGLGTIGTMCELNRQRVGIFDIKNSVTLKQLKNGINDNKFIEDNFLTVEEIFKDYPMIVLDDIKINKFLNGVKLADFNKLKDGCVKIYNKNNFIGIGTIYNGMLKRDIVL